MHPAVAALLTHLPVQKPHQQGLTAEAEEKPRIVHRKPELTTCPKRHQVLWVIPGADGYPVTLNRSQTKGFSRGNKNGDIVPLRTPYTFR